MAVVAVLEMRMVASTLAEGRAVVHRVLQETRDFGGCLAVDVVVDEADDAHLVIVETWESPEADAAYRAFRAGEGKIADLGPYLTSPPALVKGVVDPTI